MIMIKKSKSHTIVKSFGSNSDEIVTGARNNKTGEVIEKTELLKEYSQHPTGYKHQLEL